MYLSDPRRRALLYKIQHPTIGSSCRYSTIAASRQPEPASLESHHRTRKLSLHPHRWRSPGSSSSFAASAQWRIEGSEHNVLIAQIAGESLNCGRSSTTSCPLRSGCPCAPGPPRLCALRARMTVDKTGFCADEGVTPLLAMMILLRHCAEPLPPSGPLLLPVPPLIRPLPTASLTPRQRLSSGSPCYSRSHRHCRRARARLACACARR